MFDDLRKLGPTVVLVLLLLVSKQAPAQVVINELVQDERSATSSDISDTREFIELYNSGSTAVNVGDWSLALVSLDDGSEVFSVPIPGGTMLAANDYYVIGNSTGVPNVDYDFSAFGEVFPNDNIVYELRDNSAAVVDALGVNITYDPQLDFATSTQLNQIGNGWWGQTLSSNTSTPQSLGRYLDGRDTNNNGRDFGMIPLTPGASNNLPQVGPYVLPDVDGMATGTDVPGYSSSFVQPKVVDPTQTGPYVFHSIPASPQGGKAIAAWDPSGGGNMVATNSLVNSFDLYAYIDTGPLNVSTGDFEWESTVYGIGTTDPFFASPDTNAIFTAATTTNNGSTGIGWLYQREEVTNFESLMLVDFGGGGNSLPSSTDWTIIQTIDLSSSPSAWHRLSIDFDPATGEVVARYDDQVFNFTTSTDLIGTFYVGYREALSGGVPAVAGPPIYDLVVETPQENGDFDGDGDIDGNDFLIWQRGFGTGSTLAEGDANNSGTVDADDLAIWETQFGSGSLNAISIPEPNSCAVALGFVIAGIIGRTQRRP